MRTILITLDSLNRHFLSPYGGPVEMPAMDALAAEGAVFTKHFTASAPCMPARRELMTGTLELRHRGWGPLEPFDRTLPAMLGEAGVPSMMVTDHYHYFEKGGENYHTDFTGYELIRGHENDNWKTNNYPAEEVSPLSRTTPAYERARQTFRTAKDFPTAKTFSTAEAWAKENRDTESFFLYIDEFDPHEPFMVPDEYLARVEDGDKDYGGPRLDWPRYGDWQGTDTEIRHVRKRYTAKLLFLNDCLESFFATLKELDMYNDTTIILATDHGHYLGEHGKVGKPAADNWNTLFHIPMVVKPAAGLTAGKPAAAGAGAPDRAHGGSAAGQGRPAGAGRRVDALTTTPDICATILDLHGLKIDTAAYGRSFLPLVTGEADATRDYVLYGYFGGQLGYCDGTYTYFRSPVKDNEPLFYYTTRLTTHPGRTNRFAKWFAEAEGVELGRYMDGVDYPVFKIPIPTGRPEARNYDRYMEDTLFSLEDDQAQENPIRDSDLVAQYRAHLHAAMVNERFPREQFERLGLGTPEPGEKA